MAKKKKKKFDKTPSHKSRNKKTPKDLTTDSGNPLKILYKVCLTLHTALHIGCEQSLSVGSFEVMKNGAGDHIIPGTSIAGVFMETLRGIVDIRKNDEYSELFEKVYNGNIQDDQDDTKIKNHGSPLIFRTVTLNKEFQKKIRNRVKLDRQTKTAEDGSLFSYWEIEPEDVTFDVQIEIDNLSMNNSQKELETLTDWIESVFASWAIEGVFLGGHNTSGNGYCKISSEIIIKTIDTASIADSNPGYIQKWTIDSEDQFSDYLKNKDNYKNYDNSQKDSNIPMFYKTWTINVDMNDEDNDFGTNALLIKGGVTDVSLGDNPSDAVFINTGKRLFIPGSSLKGSFSAFLEKYGKNEWLKEFFGQEDSDCQGYIYFPDLFFRETENSNYKHLIHIERHAEDEFTRKIYGTGKFSEERLFYANSKGKIRVPMKFYNENYAKLDKLIKFMREGCICRLIGLGANGCYPKITIEEDKV